MTNDETHEWKRLQGNRRSGVGLEYCTVCGVVRRLDRRNNPCKGRTKMRKMETPLKAGDIEDEKFTHLVVIFLLTVMPSSSNECLDAVMKAIRACHSASATWFRVCTTANGDARGIRLCKDTNELYEAAYKRSE